MALKIFKLIINNNMRVSTKEQRVKMIPTLVSQWSPVWVTDTSPLWQNREQRRIKVRDRSKQCQHLLTSEFWANRRKFKMVKQMNQGEAAIRLQQVTIWKQQSNK